MIVGAMNNKSFMKLNTGLVTPQLSGRRGIKRQARHLAARAAADRPLWAPDVEAPSYLDNTLAGDRGFDILGLGADPKLLDYYRQAELQNGRWAMLGVAGILAQEVLNPSVFWYEAALPENLPNLYFGGPEGNVNLGGLLAWEFLLMHWVEVRRYQDIRNHHSVDEDPIFKGNKVPNEEKGYPGGIFDPFGFAKGDKKQLQEKEIKNARLAMVAFVGFTLQAQATGKGPLASAQAHIADPFKNSICIYAFRRRFRTYISCVTMTKIALYGRETSSCAFRVRIVLNVLRQDYELITQTELNEEYKKFNRQGLIPALRFGDLLLNQSLPILEYLLEEFPGSSLLPKDAAGRARVRSIAQLIVSEIQPLQNTRLDSWMQQQGYDVSQWKHHWITEGMKMLESELQDSRTQAFCHGDEVTLADACLVPQVYNAVNIYKVPMDAFPACMEIYQRCQQLPEFKSAFPAST